MEAPEPGSSTALELLGRVARSHPGLLVSGAYAAATVVGMLSSWALFARFGVNVFHYAQLQDFVVAAVRAPAATLAIVLALPSVWGLILLDNLLFERYRWYRALYGTPRLHRFSRSRWAFGLYFAGYSFFFAFLYADRSATRIRAGLGTEVTVELQSGTYLGRDGTRPFAATLLGTTSAYVLLYAVGDGAVTVVPAENVATLRYDAP